MEPVRGAQSYPAAVKQVVQSLSLYALESYLCSVVTGLPHLL